MTRDCKRTMLRRTAFTLLLAASIARAVSLDETARAFWHQVKTAPVVVHPSPQQSVGKSTQRLEAQRRADVPGIPAPVRFREVEGRGLLVQAWVNGAGAYTFALDTGAGATIISRRVARAAGVAISERAVRLGGLSGARGGESREASVRSLALGNADNVLTGRGLVIVTDGLPPDLDGVIDPSESLLPLGYGLDFVRGEMTAFDPRFDPVRPNQESLGGAVVHWLRDSDSRRPFVSLNGGTRALVDTGSGFGLALTEQAAIAFGVLPGGRGRGHEPVRDLGRGEVNARRVAPATIAIGSLVLRRVPTDLLFGTASDAPVLLGRDALRPFRLTFDPLHRLIRFAPQARP